MGWKRIMHPHKWTEPRDNAESKPVEENQEEHTLTDAQCVSWRQTRSTLTGRNRNHCTRRTRLDPSLIQLVFKDSIDKAMIVIRKKPVDTYFPFLLGLSDTSFGRLGAATSNALFSRGLNPLRRFSSPFTSDHFETVLRPILLKGGGGEIPRCAETQPPPNHLQNPAN